MASTDATINTIQHIENNLPATQDSVLEAGTVNDNAPVANTADNAAVGMIYYFLFCARLIIIIIRLGAA